MHSSPWQATGHTAKIFVKGDPYEAIIETSNQKHADLIIMGSHGKTGLERLLMGSVTERVIGHSEIAVIVVKAELFSSSSFERRQPICCCQGFHV